MKLVRVGLVWQPAPLHFPNAVIALASIPQAIPPIAATATNPVKPSNTVTTALVFVWRAFRVVEACVQTCKRIPQTAVDAGFRVHQDSVVPKANASNNAQAISPIVALRAVSISKPTFSNAEPAGVLVRLARHASKDNAFVEAQVPAVMGAVQKLLRIVIIAANVDGFAVSKKIVFKALAKRSAQQEKPCVGKAASIC
jgi:hypothetical protein